MKTATIDAYDLWGTRSAVAVRAVYRSKLLQELKGPRADQRALEATLMRNLKQLGFTHYRRYGTTKPAPLP